MEFILFNEQDIRIGDVVGYREWSDNHSSSFYEWRIDKMRIDEMEHNVDILIWSPFKENWVFLHEEIEYIEHTDNNGIIHFYRKNKYENWEEFFKSDVNN